MTYKFKSLNKDIWHLVSSGKAEAATGGVVQKRDVLRNFAKLTGKHLCDRLLKKSIWHKAYNVIVSGTGVFL